MDKNYAATTRQAKTAIIATAVSNPLSCLRPLAPLTAGMGDADGKIVMLTLSCVGAAVVEAADADCDCEFVVEGAIEDVICREDDGWDEDVAIAVTVTVAVAGEESMLVAGCTGAVPPPWTTMTVASSMTMVVFPSTTSVQVAIPFRMEHRIAIPMPDDACAVTKAA